MLLIGVSGLSVYFSSMSGVSRNADRGEKASLGIEPGAPRVMH